MGRHSSTTQWQFYRSVAGWVLPWILVAAVAGTAVWIAIDAIGDDVEPASAPNSNSGAALTSPSPTPTPEPLESPTPSPRATVKGKKEQKRGDKRKEPAPQLITEGITIQVLNGTSSSDADDRMANRLASLGFQITSIDAATTYANTTVFWSYSQSQRAAEALAARFGWEVGPKPENLSSAVAIHVVVGSDEA